VGVLKHLSGRAVALAERLGQNAVDSTQAALYLRQLLRGDRKAPVVAESPVQRAATQGPARPVLLIHGFLANRGSLHMLETCLAEAGHVVLTFRLGSLNLRDIRDSAELVASKVESLVAQTGVDRVDIVAHSMGGLLALDYIKRRGGRRRVRRLVMLGTPAKGTWTAILALASAPLGRAGLQLLPGSAFLRELERIPLPPEVDVVAVTAERDWLAPGECTLLHGVRHISLATGHTGLIMDRQVGNQVISLLAEPTVDAVIKAP
jgi:pimeloyl-ACP methyl ester carboxylesterase